MVSLLRISDAQSILSHRRQLASKPGIRIRPDLSLEERKTQSILLKERWSLIQAGTERSLIRITGAHLYVNKQKYGSVSDGEFVRSTSADASVDHGPAPTPSPSSSPKSAVIPPASPGGISSSVSA